MGTDNTDDDKAQSQNLEVRKAINDAYAFVEGQKSVQTFSAYTFEEFMDQQIESLVGSDSDTRPNERHRIDKIQNNLVQAVAKIKSMPDDAFAKRDNDKDVNTDKNG